MAEVKPSENTPAANNAGTPPAGEQTPSQPSADENTVIVSKTEFAELKRKEAMLSTAQSTASNLESELKRTRAKKIDKPETLQTPEIAQARSLITSKIMSNPEYLKLTTTNPELSKILTHEPWLLLDNDEFIDANDMADQVLGYLDKKVQVIKDSEAATAEAAAKAVTTTAPKPAQPEDTAPKGEVTDEAKKKLELEKNMSTEERIANKIGSRIQVS